MEVEVGGSPRPCSRGTSVPGAGSDADASPGAGAGCQKASHKAVEAGVDC